MFELQKFIIVVNTIIAFVHKIEENRSRTEFFNYDKQTEGRKNGKLPILENVIPVSEIQRKNFPEFYILRKLKTLNSKADYNQRKHKRE